MYSFHASQMQLKGYKPPLNDTSVMSSFEYIHVSIKCIIISKIAAILKS